MNIYIARHGQDEDNVLGILNGHRDKPLTSLGLEQAHILAEHIEKTGIKFDEVHSSPLQRAYDTAQIITKKLGIIASDTLEVLIERNFGIMTGQKAEDIEKMCSPDIIKTDTITYFLNPEGAETFPTLMVRAQQAIDLIKFNSANNDILIVCHGDIGKMIYAAYYNLPWEDVLTGFHFGNSDLLLLSKDCKPEDAQVFKQKQYNH
jgi:uncharacterized phosphatase